MQKQSYEQIPLTNDDKDMLHTIYDKRLRLFIIAYVILIVAAMIRSFGIDNRSKYTGKVIRWEEDNDDSKFISRKDMVAINMIFIEGILVITGAFIFFRRIYPYGKDIKIGMKERIPYTIIRKEYFPLTNQYYVAFDDPDYMHHEIDGDTFGRIKEGDIMYIYRAINSKYTFEQNGRFSLM